MSIITTKQLRNNMAGVVMQLQKGKSVKLSYRHKVIGVLKPVDDPVKPLRRGSAVALQSFIKTTDFGNIPKGLKVTSQNFKQKISELRSPNTA